jgi:hypothetical protein
MVRVSFLLVAMLLLFNVARAEEEGIVRVPGAFAEVGWNGRFSSGAWVEFRLVASGSGVFSAKLETSEGKVLEGLTPVTAALELPDGVGIRETRLLLPLVTTRLVKLTLISASGQATGRFEPSSEALELDGLRLPLDPGLYLRGHRVLSQLEPSIALATLAGGANLLQIPTGLPRGALGLGAVNGSQKQINMLSELEKLAPKATLPARRQPLLGFWSVGIFVVLLWLYSLRRADVRYAIGLAVCSACLAFLSWWASQPIAPFTEVKRSVLIGAKGWGLKWTVYSRFSLRADWNLPPGALPLEGEKRIERLHLATNTKLRQAGWQQVRYVVPPVATRVPIRLANRRLFNDGAVPLEKIFIRGIGRQEPLGVGSSRAVESQIYESLPWDEYMDFMKILPEGAVIAQQSDGTLLIALAEGL